jgi:hypothetical protein
MRNKILIVIFLSLIATIPFTLISIKYSQNTTLCSPCICKPSELETAPLTITNSNPHTVENEPEKLGKYLEWMKSGEGLFLTKTKTVPSFIQVLPSPYVDKTNTEHIFKFGTLHPRFSVLWKKLAEAACNRNSLIVDCGANFGYFSLFSAAMGCRYSSSTCFILELKHLL